MLGINLQEQRQIFGAIFLLGWCTTANSDQGANSAASSSPQLSSVTVETPRPPTEDELAGESVSKFVAAHGSPTVLTGQLSRWREGICLSTKGLSPAFNTFVTARILAIAAEVGAPHQTDPCKRNVQILFTAEPQKVLDELVKRTPVLLGFHYARQAQKIATSKYPIQGWYVTATREDTGLQVIDNPMPVNQATSPSTNESPLRWLESGTSPSGNLGSRLSSGLNSVIVHALILVDIQKAVGYSVGEIADYLVMMVLSKTNPPDDCGQLPSILDLMTLNCSGRDKSRAATAGDLAFLHALYAIDLRESLALEGSDIRTHMMREFKTPR